jgi:hypothetical protein
MKPCINARFCERKTRCNPQACGDYVPALASVALLTLLVMTCGCIAADAVSLSISGYSSGQGVQNLSFAGDLLNINISQNSSFQGWNITIQGTGA